MSDNNPTAFDFLTAASGHMKDRAATYDKPAGERSMANTVRAFAAMTGIEISAAQGWLFMVCLKAVRSQQGAHRNDNFEDGAAYFALYGEEAARACAHAEPLPRKVIELTPAEIQSGLDRVKWAEGLISQLPRDHEGRNSWLLNYGTQPDEPQPDTDGWIEWSGGDCPVAADVMVEVTYRMGGQPDARRAGFWDWSHGDMAQASPGCFRSRPTTDADIIAYRVIK